MAKEIEFGDTAFFTLLHLQSTLMNADFNRLGLMSYDRLRNEVDMKIEAIHLQEKERRNNNLNQKK